MRAHGSVPAGVIPGPEASAGGDSVTAVTENVYVGNAAVDAPGDRGWLLGHFKSADDVRHSDDVEIKWGLHPRDDQRAEWVIGEKRTALLMLISGRFRVELPGRWRTRATTWCGVTVLITLGMPKRNRSC